MCSLSCSHRNLGDKCASDQVCLSVEISSVCFEYYQSVKCKHPNQLEERHFDGPAEVCDLSSLVAEL